jgi:hypothetical protein
MCIWLKYVCNENDITCIVGSEIRTICSWEKKASLLHWTKDNRATFRLVAAQICASRERKCLRLTNNRAG